jgi:hypothetical protein
LNLKLIFVFYLVMFVEQLIDVELAFDLLLVLIDLMNQMHLIFTKKIFFFISSKNSLFYFVKRN